MPVEREKEEEEEGPLWITLSKYVLLSVYECIVHTTTTTTTEWGWSGLRTFEDVSA